MLWGGNSELGFQTKIEQREEKTEDMKQQEENTKNIQRKRRKKRRRTSSSSSSSLPLDLATEIFLKLPVKSVFRFSCVSKLWSSIITNPYFTNSFPTRPNLLFFFKLDNRFIVSTITQHNRNLNDSYHVTFDSYHVTFPKDFYFTRRTESVHGLICFQKAATSIFWNLIVWNPSTRKFLHLTLRKPDRSLRYITVFLGYDPVEGKHKVVCMPHAIAFDECWVLTLGSDQGSWRMVKSNYKHRPLPANRLIRYGPCNKCINGVLYYSANIDSDHVIMSFDLRTETLDVIKLPWSTMYWHVLMIYEGRLACLRPIGNSLSVWVLKDARKSEWSSHKFLPLSHYDRGSDHLFRLTGITNDGELIYVPKTMLDSFHVIYIDPKRETIRRVNYRGIADKEFRQRNGLEHKRLYEIQYFPNHIETLMSL